MTKFQQAAVLVTIAGLAVGVGVTVASPHSEDVATEPVAAEATTTTQDPPTATRPRVTATKATVPPPTTTTVPTTLPPTTVPPVVVVTPACNIEAPYNDPVNAHCWMTEDDFIAARLDSALAVLGG